MQVFSWVITVLSILGVVLNIKKNRWCFYIWAVTNFSWMCIDAWVGLWSQSFLFFIYFILAIYGIWEWRKK